MLMISSSREVQRNKIHSVVPRRQSGSILILSLLGFHLFAGDPILFAGPAAQIDEPAFFRTEGTMRITLPLRSGTAAGAADLKNFDFLRHLILIPDNN
jgi:hypothetical protein